MSSNEYEATRSPLASIMTSPVIPVKFTIFIYLKISEVTIFLFLLKIQLLPIPLFLSKEITHADFQMIRVLQNFILQ